MGAGVEHSLDVKANCGQGPSHLDARKGHSYSLQSPRGILGNIDAQYYPKLASDNVEPELEVERVVTKVPVTLNASVWARMGGA